jgi:hypothetical protein
MTRAMMEISGVPFLPIGTITRPNGVKISPRWGRFFH